MWLDETYIQASVDRGDPVPEAQYMPLNLGVFDPGDHIVLYGRKATAVGSSPLCEFEAAVQSIY